MFSGFDNKGRRKEKLRDNVSYHEDNLFNVKSFALEFQQFIFHRVDTR